MNELLRNTAANVNPDEHWIYVPDIFIDDMKREIDKYSI